MHHLMRFIILLMTQFIRRDISRFDKQVGTLQSRMHIDELKWTELAVIYNPFQWLRPEMFDNSAVYWITWKVSAVNGSFRLASYDGCGNSRRWYKAKNCDRWNPQDNIAIRLSTEASPLLQLTRSTFKFAGRNRCSSKRIEIDPKSGSSWMWFDQRTLCRW